MLDANRWVESLLGGAMFAAIFCWLRWDLASEALARIGRAAGGRVEQETSS
jgi:hypothetical protein